MIDFWVDNYGEKVSMNCPKCGFDQPEDQYCASCGVDMIKYKAPEKPKWLKLLGNWVFQLCLLVILVVFLIINDNSKTPSSQPAASSVVAGKSAPNQSSSNQQNVRKKVLPPPTKKGAPIVAPPPMPGAKNKSPSPVVKKDVPIKSLAQPTNETSNKGSAPVLSLIHI